MQARLVSDRSYSGGLAPWLVIALLQAACTESREEGSSVRDASAAGPADAGEEPRFSASSLPTYASFCEALGDLYCSTMETCCEEDDVPFQREVCEPKPNTTGGAHDALCATSSPTSYDADAAAQCLSLRARLAPGCNFRRLDDPLRLRAQQVCDRVAVHRLPGPGEVCTGFCSAPTGMISTCEFAFDSGEPSMCSPAVTPAKLGEPCAQGRFCQSPSYCDGSKCRELLADGAECIQDDECGSGSCSDEPPPTTRHCQETRRVVREACLVHTDPQVRWSPSDGYQTWSDGGYR